MAGDTELETEETDTGPPPEDTGVPFLGPTTIETTLVKCNPSEVVRYNVVTQDLTSGGSVFAQETGNPDDIYPQWADQHSLPSVSFGLFGWWDELERKLETSTPIGDLEGDVSTLFSCSNHFEASTEVMSYVVWVYDTSGNLADCVAWGHDPQGLLDDDYDRFSNPILPSADLRSCTVIR